MSHEILTRLRDATAFKPKPPDYELAIAHVPAAEAGIPHPIDDRVLGAMTSDDESFLVVVGPPGSGKSSLLTAVARHAISNATSPHPLPLKVPVAHYDVTLTADLLVKAIAQGIAYELSSVLSREQTAELEKALATTITVGRRPGGISASVGAGVPPFFKLGVAGELGRDFVNFVTNPEWQGGGPIPSLVSLRDLVAAHHARLVVIFHDTDVWSVADADMAKRARSFFGALRVLLDCPEITFIVAVQTHWTEAPEGASAQVRAAREEYRELAERVAAVLKIPQPRSEKQALDLIRAIIDRRVEITLPDEQRPESGWAKSLFTPAALKLLAHRCRTKSIRHAIADIRDALDHLSEMPERIDREQLLDVIDD